MTAELTVLTPAYRGDFERFEVLHESVLRYLPEGSVHHVVVPSADVAMFSSFSGDQCVVINERDVLPARFQQLRARGWWWNKSRIWPPVRGWILQQALKLQVASELTSRRALLADSDVAFVRPMTANEILTTDGIRLFRGATPINDGMRRHVQWHVAAREMLGLPRDPISYIDYVDSLNLWDIAVVRALQERIAQIAGRPWIDVFTERLDVSEFILYGVFVDMVVAPRQPVQEIEAPWCHNYWDATPLVGADATAFAESIDPMARAIMVSAKSGTPLDVHREIVEAAQSCCRRVP